MFPAFHASYSRSGSRVVCSALTLDFTCRCMAKGVGRCRLKTYIDFGSPIDFARPVYALQKV